MSLWHLVVREIKHRKLNFLLGLLSVAVAVGCLIGAETLLTADELVTQQILSEKQKDVETAIGEHQAAVEKAGKELQDSVRKQMLGLGFNVLILPEKQSLSEIHLDGTMTSTMPESYVDQLAQSKIMTVNHLLPSVTKRILWEEQDRDVILVGTRGEVPIQHRGMKKPLLDEVAPGKIVLGHELHTQLNLKPGDTVTLNGKEFTVTKTHDERGSVDDVTVWINLGEAQEMLGMQNLINAILALECECAGDRISQIRAEISEILPGTQVIEKYSQAVTRAESRAKAKETAELALAQAKRDGEQQLALETQSRQQLEDKHAGFAAVLVPVVILGSMMTIGLLAFANSRQRSEEVAILRAIGLTARQLMVVFLSKAAIVGLLGGLIGVGAGLWFGNWLGNPQAYEVNFDRLLTGGLLQITIIAPVMALLLAGLASWIPALLSARQDPAVILQGD